MTSSEVSSVKMPLTLSSSSQWNKWLFYVKIEASDLDVWQYLDPDQLELLLKQPIEPTYSSVKEDAIRFSELDTDERQEYQAL
jgi:hypothetical protein